MFLLVEVVSGKIRGNIMKRNVLVDKVETVKKMNVFFKDQASQNSLTEEDALEIFYAARLLNNLQAMIAISSWISTHRQKLSASLSKSQISIFPGHNNGQKDFLSLKENKNIDLLFKLNGMSLEEKKITSIALIENLDGRNLGELFEQINKKDQIKILDFWATAFDFIDKHDRRVKSNRRNIKTFIKKIRIIERICKKLKFHSELLQTILFRVLLRDNDFEGARASIAGKFDATTKKALTLEVDLHRTISEKNITAAKNVSRDLLQLALDRPQPVKKSQDLLNVENCQKALDETYKLLDDAGFEPFIFAGTLLGMVREGKIFDHDKDFDIGVLGWEKQFDIFSELYKSDNYDVNIHEIGGANTYTLSALHTPTGIAFDIFFLHDDDEYFTHGVDFNLGFTWTFRWSKFNLKVERFGKLNYRCPHPKEQFLVESYGIAWGVPDPTYDVFLMSPAAQHNRTNTDFYQFMINLRLLSGLNKGKIKLAKTIKNYLKSSSFAIDYF
ncbi:MAG: hypothetical protein VW080_11955 [Flavobacteriaceae bacterium]